MRFGRKVLNDFVQNKFLTEEALVIAIIEIEFLVNSRPLTAMSMEALTTNHFLIGRGSPKLPPKIFVDQEISSQNRWQQAQAKVTNTHIWRIPRTKWFQALPNAKFGDLALVADYGAAEGAWPLSRTVTICFLDLTMFQDQLK